MPPLLRVLLPTFILASLAGAALFALYSVVPDRSSSIDSVEAQRISAPRLEAVREEAWRPFRTLRRLSRLPEGPGTHAALRFHFDAPRSMSGEPLAIFIPTYDSSLAAYLNGRFVGEAGSVTAPIAVNAYHPALFRLPADELRAGRNEVTLIVAQSPPGIGIVHAIYIAPLRDLEPAWNWVTFASVDILRIYNGLFTVLGAFALFVYLQLRRESVFLWFTLLIFFCGLRNLDLLWTRWPESPELRAMLIFASSLGILLSCTGFVNRLGDRRARIDRWLLGLMPPLLAAFAWRAGQDVISAIDEGYAILRIVFVLVGPLMLWRMVRVARNMPSWRSGLMLGCLCMAIVFVAHDVVVMWTHPALDYQYSLLASLPMVSAFVVAVAHRYVSSARELELSHALLETRVRDTESALQASHQQLRVLEREQALAQERQRIMRDMHDGVGGQLTGLVMKLRRSPGGGDVAEAVETSLNDLRLIIDSLDEVVTGDLRTALGTFRQRIEPWLTQHGLELDWRVEVATHLGFGPRETLQLFRILQEACSNALKHSQARRIVIRVTQADDSPLLVKIEDDGRGFDPTLTTHGRGLGNMRRRARELGSELAIESDSRGTRLTLALPTPSAATVQTASV